MSDTGGHYTSGMQPRAEDIEVALDECLSRLQRGENLEDCLRLFPDQREELEPLLQTAALVRESYRRATLPAGQAQALARVRTRFMAEVEQRRRAMESPKRVLPEQKKERRWFRWTPFFGLSRGLATATLTLLLVIAVLGGGSIASANSLPGDPLYGVKRVSEQVRYFLTLGEQRRSDLLQEYEQRRLSEVKQVLAEKREADVEFSGTIEQVTDDGSGTPLIIVQGIPIRIDPQDLRAADEGLVGAEVYIEARTNQDGTLAAKQLDIRGYPGGLPPEVRPTATDTPLPKPSNTPTPTWTATPSPTLMATEVVVSPSETALPAESSTPTALATIIWSPTPSLTPTSTPTREPTPTPMPPPRDIKVRFEGRLDAIDGDHWMINGLRVDVGPTTQVDQSRGKAEEGVWVVVEAVKKTDGRLVAQRLSVVRTAEQPPQPREFSGVIETIQGDRWVVAGQELLIASDTVIEGVPAVGAVAHVKAEEYIDGRLVARRITVEKLQEVVQFEGFVQEMHEDYWIIAGQQVFLDAETSISGEAAVGSIVEVTAIEREDGSLLAQRIRVTG